MIGYKGIKMKEIKLGDNVRLKLADSPKMVVNAFKGNLVDAIYMTQSGHPETITVNINTLIKIKGN
jgi:hypothetical protein